MAFLYGCLEVANLIVKSTYKIWSKDTWEIKK